MNATPGPWRYEAATKTIRAVPSNYWLATMDSWDGAVNNEANAQLIASAPQILEALKALTDRVDLVLYAGYVGHDLIKQCRLAISQAQEGI